MFSALRGYLVYRKVSLKAKLQVSLLCISSNRSAFNHESHGLTLQLNILERISFPVIKATVFRECPAKPLTVDIALRLSLSYNRISFRVSLFTFFCASSAE